MKISRGVKWGCVALVVGVLSLTAILYLLDTFMPSAARRALPESATDIQEYYSDSWNGDFVCLIKAQLPEGDARPKGHLLAYSTWRATLLMRMSSARPSKLPMVKVQSLKR